MSKVTRNFLHELEPNKDLYFLFNRLNLGPNQSTTFELCPFCHGGENKDTHTFGVIAVDGQDQGWLYNCLRAKCGSSGFVRKGNVTGDLNNSFHKHLENNHGIEDDLEVKQVGATTNFSDDEITVFECCYPNLTRKDFLRNGVKRLLNPKSPFKQEEDIAVFPLKVWASGTNKALGYTEGLHVRSMWPGGSKRTWWSTKEANKYNLTPFPYYGTAYNKDGEDVIIKTQTPEGKNLLEREKPLVLVEDAISGMILSKHLPVRVLFRAAPSSVALSAIAAGGTGQGPPMIYWPDPDMWHTEPHKLRVPPAVSITRRIRKFVKCEARRLPSDPKYLKKEEMISFLVDDLCRLGLEHLVKDEYK